MESPASMSFPPTLPGQAPPAAVFQQGKHILLIRQGMPMPTDRCYKCSAPASVTKRKMLAWHHPAIYLAILASLLLYIILALCLQKRASVVFGLCERCHNRRILWISIWLMVALSCVPLFTLGIAQSEWIYGALGGVALIAGLIGLLLAGRIGYARKIDDVQILLGGSGQAFRDYFPSR